VTDRAWVEGFRELQLAYPNREQAVDEADGRSALYRRHLDDLTDEQWRHAVAEVIRAERWFPTVAALREYAEGYVPANVRLLAAGPDYLANGPRSEDQKALDRTTAQAGLALVKAVVAKQLGGAPPLPALREVTAGPRVVVAHGDRLDELRRQREAIVAEAEVVAR